jgi:hypothetical protein
MANSTRSRAPSADAVMAGNGTSANFESGATDAAAAAAADTAVAASLSTIEPNHHIIAHVTAHPPQTTMIGTVKMESLDTAAPQDAAETADAEACAMQDEPVHVSVNTGGSGAHDHERHHEVVAAPTENVLQFHDTAMSEDPHPHAVQVAHAHRQEVQTDAAHTPPQDVHTHGAMNIGDEAVVSAVHTQPEATQTVVDVDHHNHDLGNFVFHANDPILPNLGGEGEESKPDQENVQHQDVDVDTPNHDDSVNAHATQEAPSSALEQNEQRMVYHDTNQQQQPAPTTQEEFTVASAVEVASALSQNLISISTVEHEHNPTQESIQMANMLQQNQNSSVGEADDAQDHNPEHESDSHAAAPMEREEIPAPKEEVTHTPPSQPDAGISTEEAAIAEESEAQTAAHASHQMDMDPTAESTMFAANVNALSLPEMEVPEYSEQALPQDEDAERNNTLDVSLEVEAANSAPASHSDTSEMGMSQSLPIVGMKRKYQSGAIKTEEERKRMPRQMGGCKERRTKRTKASFDQILNEAYMWEKISYANFLNQGYVWDAEYEEYQDLSIATPIFCLACGVNVGFGKKSMAQHIHGVSKNGKPTRHELKVARMDPEILLNPPRCKPVTTRAATAELTMDPNGNGTNFSRITNKKQMIGKSGGPNSGHGHGPMVNFGSSTAEATAAATVGLTILTGPVGKKSFQALLKEPYVWEGTDYDGLLGQTYTLHPNGRIVCKACNAIIDYSKRAMCQHVHGRKKGDRQTKHQENVIIYNDMIQSVHGGIEPEFNFDDTLLIIPDDPLATAAAAAAAAQDITGRPLTVMERVMRIEKRWMGEMLSKGSMRDRMVNLEDFIFGAPGDGSFMARLSKLEDELKVQNENRAQTREVNANTGIVDAPPSVAAPPSPCLFRTVYTPAAPRGRGGPRSSGNKSSGAGRANANRARLDASRVVKEAERALEDAQKHQHLPSPGLAQYDHPHAHAETLTMDVDVASKAHQGQEQIDVDVQALHDALDSGSAQGQQIPIPELDITVPEAGPPKPSAQEEAIAQHVVTHHNGETQFQSQPHTHPHSQDYHAHNAPVQAPEQDDGTQQQELQLQQLPQEAEQQPPHHNMIASGENVAFV